VTPTASPIRIGSTFAATASFLTSSDDYIGKVLNTDPTKYSTYGHYLYQTVPVQEAGRVRLLVPGSRSSTRTNVDFLRELRPRADPDLVKSQPLGGVEFDLFMFHTLADGRAYERRDQGPIDNIKPSSAPERQPYGHVRRRGPLVLRHGLPSGGARALRQPEPGPDSPNYIARRIGDMNESVRHDDPQVRRDGRHVAEPQPVHPRRS
jgi:hypothetical protein